MREYTSAAPAGADAGAVVVMEPVTFKLDGEEFTCLGEITGDSLLEWSELGLAAANGAEIDSPEGSAYLARFLRASMGNGEYQRLRLHIRTRATHPGVVLQIVTDIQGAMADAVTEATGRPTKPPSPSSPGPEDPGGERARVISLQQGTVQYADPPPPRPRATGRRRGGAAKDQPATG